MHVSIKFCGAYWRGSVVYASVEFCDACYCVSVVHVDVRLRDARLHVHINVDCL